MMQEAPRGRVTALEALTALGLTEYAAKAYAALVTFGEADAERVATQSGVPRTKVYDALEELARRGWAKDGGGRPRRWRAESPADCVARERQRLDALVALHLPDLEAQFEKRAVRVAGAVWVLEGAEAVEAKAEEMLRRARRSAMMALGEGMEIDARSSRALRAAGARGVRLQVMTADPASAPALAKAGAAVRLAPFPTRALIVDAQQALIYLPREDGELRAVWNPSADMVGLMSTLFTRVWTAGRPWPE